MFFIFKYRVVIEPFFFIIQGIGNSVATWQPCFLALSGTNIFVLEFEKSQTYQRYSRLPLSLSLPPHSYVFFGNSHIFVSWSPYSP